MKSNIEKIPHQTFENIKQIDVDSNEFWYARELHNILDYARWDKFKNVIDKAKIACTNSKIEINDHFRQVGKMVELGSGAQRDIENIMLTRYACYLIVQNADSSKPIIANGQTYFAIQTRKQELNNDSTFNQLQENEKRVFLRNEQKLERQAKSNEKKLIKENALPKTKGGKHE